jgi:hypothetical protein
MNQIKVFGTEVNIEISESYYLFSVKEKQMMKTAVFL